MVTDSSVERTNDTFVLYFGWMKKKSQNSSKFLHFTTCSFACSASLLLLYSAQVPWARDRPVYAHRSKDRWNLGAEDTSPQFSTPYGMK